MTEMEAHIQQTNDRLLCIQQQLAVPGETFQSAARELLEWCSDMRAFQPHFEQRLFTCLMVIQEVAAQPGFDLDLGYRLMALCAAHGDKFTPKSAGVLSSWCEELGRLVLVRHQKTPTANDCLPATQKLNAVVDGMQWQQQQQQSSHHEPLSVATSVWGAPGPGPAGTQQLQPGQQSMMSHHLGGPGLQSASATTGGPLGGYPQSIQRPMGSGAAGMNQFQRGGPNSMAAGAMFPDGGSGTSGVATMQKYNSYGVAGMRQPGANVPFSQHSAVGLNPHEMMSGPSGSIVSGGSIQMDDPSCQSRANSTAITLNQVGHCGGSQQMPNVYGMQYNHHQQQQQQQQSQQQYPGSVHRMTMSGTPVGPGQGHPAGPNQQNGPAMAPVGTGGLGAPIGSAVPADDQTGGTVGGSVGGGPIKGSGNANKGPGGGNGVYLGHQQRLAPYPNPAQYMQSKRPHFVNGQTPQDAMYAMGQQYPVGPAGQSYGQWVGGRPGPGSHMSPGYPAGQPRPNPSAVAGGYCPSVGGVPGAGGQGNVSGYMMPVRPAGYNAQFMAGQGGYMNPMYGGGQHLSPVMSSGNQQSSKAPSSAMVGGGVPPSYNSLSNMPPSYMSPTGVPPSYSSLPGVPPTYSSPPASEDIKPVVMNGKIDVNMPPSVMMIKKEDAQDDLRLTFPVRDGVVLPPFRLEHNLSVSNHVFHLRESVYQTLMWRPDLELQLKCFHHEDRQMATNWPMSVSISVNSTLLHIDRSADGVASHRPLYLKDVCQPGRNTIQITVSACCCSHLFVLQLVHRPSVKSVLQGLLRKRLLPAEHCVTKIKRSFVQPGVTSATMAGGGTGGDNEEHTIKLSLKCPITYRTITLPARGHDCKHIQCFDLESYLQINCERGLWRCPICNKSALLEGLEIDQYIWGILNNLSGTEFEDVTLDPSASWKPVPVKSVKEEDANMKRWNKAISPSSMNLPTMSSWQDSNNFFQSASRPNQQQQQLQQQQQQQQQHQQQHQQQQQQQQPFFQGGVSMNCYDRGQGQSPSFSPIGTPDFLSSLTHMGDNLLHSDIKCSTAQPSDGQIKQPRTPLDGQMVNNHIRLTTDGQSGHPRTPLDGQMCSNPRTPLDGQLVHPRTPLDGAQLGCSSTSQLRTPLDGQLMHPRTPMDGHMASHPRTPMDGQMINPRTPVDGSQMVGCPRTPVDNHHFHVGDSNCQVSGDVSSLRPMPGTPGSNPRTPAGNGNRTYPPTTVGSVAASACSSRSGSNASCGGNGVTSCSSGGANGIAGINNNNNINSMCSNDSGQQLQSVRSNGGNILNTDFAFVDNDGQSHETLDLLQDGIDDPTELLSYLGPSADVTGTGSGTNNPDDLLSLFT